MANYANIPYQLYEDLAEGKINSKMFLVLVWLLRRADYSSGVAIKVSAPRIRAEMWGDDLEDGIPSERTIQEILKRLDRAGYIKSHHVKGRKASYPVSLNNFSAAVKGQDGKTISAVLRAVDTTCWRDLPEFGRGDCNGDTAVMLRGDCGDSHSDSDGDCDSDSDGDASAYTTDSLDSSPSTDTSASPALPAMSDVRRPTSGRHGAKGESPSGDREGGQGESSVTASAMAPGSNPVSVSDDDAESTSDTQYEQAVTLCSLWWATHSVPGSDTIPVPDTSSVPPPHPWGHPRTWTPAQRREALLRAIAGNDENSLRLVVPAPAPENDPEPRIDFDAAAKREESLLRDEGFMLELIQRHGYDAMEELLRWLPKSTNWFGSGRLHSLAQLLDFRTWDFITADMQRYYAKALENNSEASCDEYVERIFLAAGGDTADSIRWERLHPLPPLDPQDAAEEESMDAFDNLHGTDFHDVWGEHDVSDAAAAPHSQGPCDALFSPWPENDDNGPATLPATHSAEEDDADQGISRYCTKCGSAHARACLNDVDYDLE